MQLALSPGPAPEGRQLWWRLESQADKVPLLRAGAYEGDENCPPAVEDGNRTHPIAPKKKQSRKALGNTTGSCCIKSAMRQRGGSGGGKAIALRVLLLGQTEPNLYGVHSVRNHL